MSASAAYRTFLEALENSLTLTPFNVISCNKLIKRLGDEGKTQEALAVYRVMRERGGDMAPTVVTYSTLLSRLIRNKKKDSVLSSRRVHDMQKRAWTANFCTSAEYYLPVISSLLRNLFADGLQPDIVVFNSVMAAASAIPSSSLAWDAYSLISKSGVSPTIRTFNQMMVAVGRDLSQGMKAVDSILELVDRAGLEPDVFTYSSWIDACALRGETQHAFQILEKMNHDGVEANERTYTSVVAACCRSNDLDKGRAVLSNMIRCGKGNVYAFTLLIDHYGKANRLDDAFQLFSEMCRHPRAKPNAHTYSALIQACGKSRAIDIMFEGKSNAPHLHKSRRRCAADVRSGTCAVHGPI